MFRFPTIASAFGAGIFAICAAQGGSFPSQNDYSRTSGAGVFPLMITAGALDPAAKVPAINAVKGSKINNISVPFPLGVLQHGNIYNIIIATQNTTWKGTCHASYKIVQNGETISSGNIQSYTCKPGDCFMWVKSSDPIPEKLGAATLVGTVQFRNRTASISVPVVIV
jgi:hypothetical protein